MTPKVHFRLLRGTLRARIKIRGLREGLYDTGIPLDKAKFDVKKQICGEPSIQGYMAAAKGTIEREYRPGMTPAELWTIHIGKEASTKPHCVRDAFDYYLTQVKISDSTRNNFGYTRDKAMAGGLMLIPLCEITPAMVLKWLNGLTGLKEVSVYNEYIQFKTVINRYVRDHSLNLVLRLEKLLKAPKQKQTVEGQEEYLTLAEVRELLAKPLGDRPDVEKVRDLFCLMAFTGMAIADLSRFTLDWVSSDSKWLTYYRKKSGGKCEIPILPITRDLMKKYDWPHYVPNRTIQWQCQKNISVLVGKKVTPHTARHTWGCVALEFGFSMESVSKMLGHASIRITERIYAKVTRAKIEREMQEIPNSIRELMKT